MLQVNTAVGPTLQQGMSLSDQQLEMFSEHRATPAHDFSALGCISTLHVAAVRSQKGLLS